MKAASKRGEDVALIAAQLRGAPAPHPVKPEPSGDEIGVVVEQWQKWPRQATRSGHDEA